MFSIVNLFILQYIEIIKTNPSDNKITAQQFFILTEYQHYSFDVFSAWRKKLLELNMQQWMQWITVFLWNYSITDR